MSRFAKSYTAALVPICLKCRTQECLRKSLRLFENNPYQRGADRSTFFITLNVVCLVSQMWKFGTPMRRTRSMVSALRWAFDGDFLTSKSHRMWANLRHSPESSRSSKMSHSHPSQFILRTTQSLSDKFSRSQSVARTKRHAVARTVGCGFLKSENTLAPTLPSSRSVAVQVRFQKPNGWIETRGFDPYCLCRAAMAVGAGSKA